jgi:hypothetical protein
MTTVSSSRVQVVSFQGGGDDMDIPIKRILTTSSNRISNQDEEEEEETRDDVLVCGVNSYNIGRPLMQAVHYVSYKRRGMHHMDFRIIHCGSATHINACSSFLYRYGRT